VEEVHLQGISFLILLPFSAAVAPTVTALQFPSLVRDANRAVSSKQPRFTRRWRRFGCFPCGSGQKWKKCTCKEYHQ